MSPDREFSFWLRFLQRRPEVDRKPHDAAPSLKVALCAPDEASYERALDALVGHHLGPAIAQAVASRVGSRKRGVGGSTLDREGAEDLFAEALYRALRKLRELRERGSDGSEIADLRRYVSAVVANCVSDRLREAFPVRRSVDTEVQRVLTRTPGLACWKAPYGHVLGGLEKWRDSTQPPARGGRYERFLADPRPYEHRVLKSEAVGDTRGLVAAILRWVGAPVPLVDLVSIVQALQGRVDSTRATPEADQQFDHLEVAADDAPGPESQLLLKERAGEAWKVILNMPRQWRVAYLLGGRERIIEHFWPREADLAELASALEIEEIALARLFNDLPLDDAAIAQLLRVKTGSVTTARWFARGRLEPLIRCDD